MTTGPILTLTTDFGHRDHRLAALKVQLYQCIPAHTVIVDVSHEITPYDLVETAYLFESVKSHYSDHTIHLLWVYQGEESDILIAKYRSGWLILPDNGLLSMIQTEEKEEEIYRLPGDGHLYRTIAETIGSLITHDIQDLNATPTESYKQRIAIQPVFSKNEIRASFLHADRYGNVVMNLRKRLFEEIADGRSFEIFYKGMEPITVISHSYADVTPGEILCMFNDAGYLQLSQSIGSAVQALDMHRDDTIQILFYD